MKPNDKAIDAGFEASAISVNGSVFGRVSRSTMKEILEAAYAAQFQSEDYAGLVKELRERAGSYDSHDYHEEIELKAADAIEALLAERDALKHTRDDLLAHLAPKEDEALVEIVAREIAFAQGDVESPNSEFMDENWHCWKPEARAAIAAIRPHIEAAEREKWQKMLARMGAGTTKTGAVNE